MQENNLISEAIMYSLFVKLPWLAK